MRDSEGRNLEFSGFPASESLRILIQNYIFVNYRLDNK